MKNNRALFFYEKGGLCNFNHRLIVLEKQIESFKIKERQTFSKFFLFIIGIL